MIPKWIGFMPTAVTIGRRIGVRIRFTGVVSMTIPRSKEYIDHQKDDLIGKVRQDPVLSPSVGSASEVRTLENAIDAARMNMIGA